LDKIREIYLNCPKGHHVDHIIPLQGKLVSGLHVENNLQYLTSTENHIKNNKFQPYIENIEGVKFLNSGLK
jgi:5-methylcytosine-specific restriction endonuclease McrA